MCDQLPSQQLQHTNLVLLYGFRVLRIGTVPPALYRKCQNVESIPSIQLLCPLRLPCLLGAGLPLPSRHEWRAKVCSARYLPLVYDSRLTNDAIRDRYANYRPIQDPEPTSDFYHDFSRDRNLELGFQSPILLRVCS